jgi:hypothetical protein
MATIRATDFFRKLGGIVSKGKITFPGHSRPLTSKQAKDALARDLGKKNWEALKKSPDFQKLIDAKDAGFKLAGKGVFKEQGKGRRANLEQAVNRIAKKEGYKSDEFKREIDRLVKSDTALGKALDASFKKSQTDSEVKEGKVAAEYMKWKKAKSKSARRNAQVRMLKAAKAESLKEFFGYK